MIDLSLYLVTDRTLIGTKDLYEIVEQAVEGGVSVVQLREKNCSSREFYNIARRLKEALHTSGVPLIINDRLDIALAVEAEGLHIGQSDLPYSEARRLLGKERIIGISVETVEDARRAQEIDVDYIGISPVFSTLTKHDIARPLGLIGVQEIQTFNRHPAVGIGGINPSNASNVIRAGANGIAVVSAILCAANPCLAAQYLRNEITKSR